VCQPPPAGLGSIPGYCGTGAVGAGACDAPTEAHRHGAQPSPRRLHQRASFTVEGRCECLLVHGRLIDELYMAKLPARPAE
jgi:hypothetical protein